MTCTHSFGHNLSLTNGGCLASHLCPFAQRSTSSIPINLHLGRAALARLCYLVNYLGQGGAMFGLVRAKMGWRRTMAAAGAENIGKRATSGFSLVGRCRLTLGQPLGILRHILNYLSSPCP